MSEEYYFNSSTVRMFPSAYRGIPQGTLYDVESRINSENQSTSENKFLTRYSGYVVVPNVSNIAVTSNTYPRFKFYIKGYKFEVSTTELLSAISSWTNVWAVITIGNKVASWDSTKEDNNVDYQEAILKSINSASDTTLDKVISSNNKFVGLKITDTEPSETISDFTYTYKLKILDRTSTTASWFVPVNSLHKFSLNDIRGEGTISGNVNVTGNVGVTGDLSGTNLSVSANSEIGGTLRVVDKATFVDEVVVGNKISFTKNDTSNAFEIFDGTQNVVTIDKNGLTTPEVHSDLVEASTINGVNISADNITFDTTISGPTATFTTLNVNSNFKQESDIKATTGYELSFGVYSMKVKIVLNSSHSTINQFFDFVIDSKLMSTSGESHRLPLFELNLSIAGSTDDDVIFVQPIIERKNSTSNYLKFVYGRHPSYINANLLNYEEISKILVTSRKIA